MKRLFLLATALILGLGGAGRAQTFPANPIANYREVHLPGEAWMHGSIEISNGDYVDYAVTIDSGNSTVHIYRYVGGEAPGEIIRAGEAITFPAVGGRWEITGESGEFFPFNVYDKGTTTLDFIPEGDVSRRIIGMRVEVRGRPGSSVTLMNWAERSASGWPHGNPPPPRPAPNPNPYDPYPPRPAPNPNPYDPYPPRPAPNPNPYDPYPPRPAPNPNPYDPYPPHPAPNPNPWEPDPYNPYPPYPAPNPTPDGGIDWRNYDPENPIGASPGLAAPDAGTADYGAVPGGDVE